MHKSLYCTKFLRWITLMFFFNHVFNPLNEPSNCQIMFAITTLLLICDLYFCSLVNQFHDGSSRTHTGYHVHPGRRRGSVL